MRASSRIGQRTALLLSLVPLFIWLVVRNGEYGLDDIKAFSYSLGQLAALVGTAMFAITFILTLRIKNMEDYFGGLDKLYAFHHKLGAVSFILLLFHPLLLLVKFLPQQVKLAASFLIPGAQWAYNFGIIALALMIILLVMTFFIRMKYQNWKISHKLMGILYMIAIFHFFFVTTDISRFPVLKYYMMFISLIGMAAYLYTSYISLVAARKYEYTVDRVTREGDVHIFELKPNGKHLEFMPGQFAFVQFMTKGLQGEPHPFTIASAQKEDGKVRFAIKSLGDYTKSLVAVKRGDKVLLQGPFGRFVYSLHKHDQIWVAGGIGITPFLGFIEDLKNNKHIGNIYFFYCTKNEEEMIFLDEVDAAAKDDKRLKVIPQCSDKQGFLTVDMIKKECGTITDKHIFICGPPIMREKLVAQLEKKGVKKKMIHFERFDLK